MLDLSGITYSPSLTIRPAEMLALEKLPNATKSKMLPHIRLRPWVNSRFLDNSLDQISALKCPQLFIDLDWEFDTTEKSGERPVFKKLRELKNPENGHDAWTSFVETTRYIPAIQKDADIANFGEQVRKLTELGRGLLYRVTPESVGNHVLMLGEIERLKDQSTVVIEVDAGQRVAGWEQEILLIDGLIGLITQNINPSAIVVSASTFPGSFDTITSQSIYERGLFSQLRSRHSDVALIYGDRGGARAKRDQGGGGAPLPRIDLALPTSWYFYRERPKKLEPSSGESEAVEGPDERRKARKFAYKAAALRARNSEHWPSIPNIWSKEQILKTAEDEEVIGSPARSTATRLNMHMYMQCNYADVDDGNADEDWSDL